MSASRVSIALCTYNGERFLQPQLDSFAQQTRLPDEVIVCDDGSTDATVSIVNRWSESVPFPVHVTVNGQNLGFAKNFEQAIGFCSGDVIFLSDQDDVWYPDRIERVMAEFEKDDSQDVGLVYCNAQIVDENLNATGVDLVEFSRFWHRYRDPFYFLPEEFCESDLFAGCITALRKEVADRLFPIPVDFPHDIWIYLIGRYYTKLKTLFVPLHLHRLHGFNNSNGASVDAHRFLDIQYKNNYYRDSVFLFNRFTNRRNALIERLRQLPDSPLRRRHLQYLNRLKRHFNRRVLLEHGGLRQPFVALLNWLDPAAGYFSFPQPLWSFLFDVKEGFFRLK